MTRKVVVFVGLLLILLIGLLPPSIQAQDGYLVRIPIHPDFQDGTYDITIADEAYLTYGWGACLPPEGYTGQYWRRIQRHPPLEDFRESFLFFDFEITNSDDGTRVVSENIWWPEEIESYYRPISGPRPFDACWQPDAGWEYYVLPWYYPLDLEPGTYEVQAIPYILGRVIDWTDQDEDGQPDSYRGAYWYRHYDIVRFHATINVTE